MRQVIGTCPPYEPHLMRQPAGDNGHLTGLGSEGLGESPCPLEQDITTGGTARKASCKRHGCVHHNKTYHRYCAPMRSVDRPVSECVP